MVTQHTETPQNYLDNARDTLKKAVKRDRFYTYPKYVKMASHIAYCGMLLALEPLLTEAARRKKRKKVDDYRDAVAKHGGPVRVFTDAYIRLHEDGGYSGDLNATVIQEGLRSATEVIDWAEKATRQKAR